MPHGSATLHLTSKPTPFELSRSVSIPGVTTSATKSCASTGAARIKSWILFSALITLLTLVNVFTQELTSPSMLLALPTKSANSTMTKMRAHIGIRQFVVVHMVGDWNTLTQRLYASRLMRCGMRSVMPGGPATACM